MIPIRKSALMGCRIFESRSKVPKYLIVLFHGYDSNGKDFAKIRKSFSRFLPDTYIFAPNAPIIMSESKLRWFEVSSTSNDKIFDQLETLSSLVNDSVDEIQDDFELNDSQIFFVGFSQGASVALHAALERHGQVAGVVCYSGHLIKPTRLRELIRSRPPVCLIHGREDPIIPLETMSDAISFLMSEKINVKSHVCAGLKHSINKEAAVHGTRFMVNVLSEPLRYSA